jgi:hypothetical protein
MVVGLAIRDPDGRPQLGRSRSHTTPSSSAVPRDIEQTAVATTRSSPRPSTPGRSHSYLSPTEPKPHNAQTLPTETTKHSHTLHLPGRSHREHKHHGLRHRHTQSEAKNSKRGSTDSLPHLIANLKREEIAQKQRQNLSRQSTQTSTSTWQSHMNNLVRIASTDPYRNFGATGDASGPAFGAAYYRAHDGTASRQPTTKPQTWIELALDKVDAKKELERLNPKPADVERKQNELANGQAELRDRLADVGRQSGEIGRRLEYTYYALLEKLGSLVGTIHSFQSLSEQSRQLIKNFESETSKLDEDIQRRVSKFGSTFEERDVRVAEMEERSMKAGRKAQELQTRLQNVRTIIENWEKREDAAVKKWFRVWGFVFWGSVIVFMLIISIVAYKESWFRGDPVLAGLGAGPVRIDTRPGNHSLAMNIPEDVRTILDGIEEKRAGKKAFARLPEKVDVVDERLERKRDKQLRMLDEL